MKIFDPRCNPFISIRYFNPFLIIILFLYLWTNKLIGLWKLLPQVPQDIGGVCTTITRLYNNNIIFRTRIYTAYATLLTIIIYYTLRILYVRPGQSARASDLFFFFIANDGRYRVVRLEDLYRVDTEKNPPREYK